MKNKKILLSEDEESLRKVMKAYYIKEGAEVFEAKDGEEALKIFNDNSIDLVILDIMMPKYDGWSVCEKIREDSQVPILMLTARSEENDKLLGFELGADDYMTKPFSLKELIARSRALLRRSQNRNNQKEEIKINGLKINMTSRKVFIQDKEIDMTPKEYDLLNYFLINSNQALSREMILDAVWGYDYYGDLRTVDTHVKRLRGKLGEYGGNIITVRSFGYRLEVEK